MWVVCVNFTVGLKCYVGGLCQFDSGAGVLSYGLCQAMVCVKFMVEVKFCLKDFVSFVLSAKFQQDGPCQFHDGCEALTHFWL